MIIESVVIFSKSYFNLKSNFDIPNLSNSFLLQTYERTQNKEKLRS